MQETNNLCPDDTYALGNPFLHAQDRETFYTTEAERAHQEYLNEKKEDEKSVETKDLKRKKSNFNKKVIKKSPTQTSSNVIRKETGKPHHLIKIHIYDLTRCDKDNEQNCIIYNDVGDSADVTIQYLVKDDYDENLDETEQLVGKIVKKISNKQY